MTDKLRRLFTGDEKLTVDRGPENRTGREACLGRCSVEAERDRLRAENARLTLALDEALAGYAHVDPNTRRGDDPQAVADDLTASRERGSFVPGIPGWAALEDDDRAEKIRQVEARIAARREDISKTTAAIESGEIVPPQCGECGEIHMSTELEVQRTVGTLTYHARSECVGCGGDRTDAFLDASKYRAWMKAAEALGAVVDSPPARTVDPFVIPRDSSPARTVDPFVSNRTSGTASTTRPRPGRPPRTWPDCAPPDQGPFTTPTEEK